jgi:lactate permease
MIAGAAVHDVAMEEAVRRREGTGPDSKGDIARAFAPYVIIIAVLSLAQWGPIKDLLAKGATEFDWPGLNILNAKGEAPSAVTYKLNYLPAAGTLLLFSGLLTMVALRLSPGRALRVYGRTLDQLKWATLTVAAVLGLAYVMNLSAQTITIGTWIAGAGGVLGKMISPQNLAIGAAVCGLAGREGDLFRRVIGWSILLLLIMCVLVYLQSTSVLSWMVV